MTKSIKQQYIDLREGRMSQSNFLRNVRMSLPHYVTNLNNFDSTIKILKNKGILNENDIYGVAGNPEEEAEMKSMDLKNYNVDTEQLKQGTEVEMEHTNDPKVAERIAMDHIKEDPEYYIKLKSIGLEEANSNLIDWNKVAILARKAGTIVKDAESELTSLAIANENGVSKEQIKSILDKYDIEISDLKGIKVPIEKGTWSLDDLANRGYLEEANPGIDPTQEEDYKPLTSSKSDYKIVNSDGEVALLKDKNGDQFIFYYSDNKKEIEPYSSDGYDIDDMAIQHYINDNSYGLSKGVGMVDYEAGKDLVKVDDNLKDNFADLFSTNENQEELSPKMKHIQKSMGKMDSKPTTAERRAELEKLIAAKKAKQQVNEETDKIPSYKDISEKSTFNNDEGLTFYKNGISYQVYIIKYNEGPEYNIWPTSESRDLKNPNFVMVNNYKDFLNWYKGKPFENVADFYRKTTGTNKDVNNININGKNLNESKEQKGGASGKELYSHFKEMDLVNSQELLIGIDWEMQKSFSLSKKDAAKKAIKNIKKVPNYYTMLCLSGVEGAEPQYYSKDVKPEDWQMKPFSADKTVDKGLGMKPVKGFNKEKASANKAHKETNKGVSGVEELTHKAVRARGIKGVMDMTGGDMKKIREAVDKALAKSRLEESSETDKTETEAKVKALLSLEAYRAETGWNENELNEFLNSFTNEDIEHDYQAFVVGGLNENLTDSNKYISIENDNFDGGEYHTLNKESIGEYLKSVIDPEEIDSVDIWLEDDEGFGQMDEYFWDGDDDTNISEEDVENAAKMEMSYYLFSKPDEFPYK